MCITTPAVTCLPTLRSHRRHLPHPRTRPAEPHPAPPSPLQRVIELGAGFHPAVLCHPDTYLNKVLVGSGAAGGRMQLWNFRTGSMLYEFKGWCVQGPGGKGRGVERGGVTRSAAGLAGCWAHKRGLWEARRLERMP